MAEASGRLLPERGWLRRWFPRDRSAAALIRRYRLWPAIEHAYERVVRAFGPVRVEVSVEDPYWTEFVMVVFHCESVDAARMIDLGTELVRECLSVIPERHWHRLVVCVEPDPDMVPVR